MSENLNKVEFTVPLSGSNLFDLHARVTAKHLCDLYPPLNYRVSEDEKNITIYGNLNDFWYAQWCRAMFELGENK